jgi:hypothetical protein
LYYFALYIYFNEIEKTYGLKVNNDGNNSHTTYIEGRALKLLNIKINYQPQYIKKKPNKIIVPE